MSTVPTQRRQAAGETRGTTPVVRLAGVRKAFGEQVVLDGLDLRFTPAETTVVMGPSGCGKSVMLKHIVGLLKPDAGEVWVGEDRVDRLGERALSRVRTQIGLLFQMGALFDSMTVGENIEFPLVEHTRLSPAERRERVNRALDMVDMAGTEWKLPSQLSGGQRKRVALARAVVLEPRVVLYDEPTTGLDPVRSDGINELIIRMKDRLGVTNIVVTHDLVSARKIADRVVMLLGGRIVAEGSYEDLTRHPDPRVQHFLDGVYDPADEEPAESEAGESARETME